MPTTAKNPSRIVPATRWAALLLAAACAGCQAAVPRSWPGLEAAREEQRILKLAKRDPFPSPADVGLDAPTSVP